MTTITAPTYDPTTTAAALAEKYTTSAQTRIDNQTAAASATATALSSLSSAISTFQTSLSALTGLGKTVLASSATLSDTTVGSASAKATAAAGTYNLFVKQLATAGQVSYNGLADGAAAGGTLKIKLSDETPGSTATPVTFNVDLSAASADTDKDNVLSIREVAAAINADADNAGKLSASVVTIDGTPRLVMTSKNTGVANTISLDASGVTDTTLKAGLGTRTMVTAAQDAIVLFGGTSGTPITQSSNTFTNIDGVTMTFTRAQAPTESAMTLTVGSDDTTTVSNVKAFVNAYNTLKEAIDALVDPGDPANSVDAGAFAHDAGVKALQSRLVSMLRPTSGSSLASYGITANRDGTLDVDSTRLGKQLAADPSGLATLIGSSSASGSSGMAGNLNTYLNQWSNTTTGQIKQRTEANSKLQADLTTRQTDLDAKYDSAYARYLKQFTDLQTLQATMTSNVSIFDALFSSDDS
jgi:flagellar hook-associated protein 2